VGSVVIRPENYIDSPFVVSFVARSDDYDHDLLTRSLDFDSLEIRELSFLKERDFDIGDGTYYKVPYFTWALEAS
jgi:hypothetical protein